MLHVIKSVKLCGRTSVPHHAHCLKSCSFNKWAHLLFYSDEDIQININTIILAFGQQQPVTQPNLNYRRIWTLPVLNTCLVRLNKALKVAICYHIHYARMIRYMDILLVRVVDTMSLTHNMQSKHLELCYLHKAWKVTTVTPRCILSQVIINHVNRFMGHRQNIHKEILGGMSSTTKP